MQLLFQSNGSVPLENYALMQRTLIEGTWLTGPTRRRFNAVFSPLSFHEVTEQSRCLLMCTVG